ncbi:MAG: lysophospholipid acyltransferase family protein [Fusobacteria bacterium]|nr:lysophospholipid acyltransferase family protein [Fusobacteriota bacterium]
MANKYRFYGHLMTVILKLLKMTIKVYLYKSKDYVEGGTYIYVFWHQYLYGPSVSIDKIRVEKIATLASPSNDGEIISTVLKNFGYKVVRGSSNDKNVGSLLSLIKLLKKGYSIGTPVDGPKGPIFEVKPGLVYLAQKTGIPIVPIGLAYSNYWSFEKAWDKFKLPKPFSKIAGTLLEPIYIPSEMNIVEACIMVKNQIDLANLKAEKIL